MIQVLIANDERAASSLIQRIINRTTDMTCIGRAYNGEEAVRMAQALRPDVVLMDLMMPGMDGVEATLEIRKTVPQTKIIVNTARVDFRQRALNAGAKIVLTGPIVDNEILAAIRDVVDHEENEQPTE